MMKKIILLFWFSLLFVGFQHSSVANGSLTIAPQDSVRLVTIDGKKYVLYEVEAGETLYSISRKYKVLIDDVKEANPELQQGLKAGQIIKIPYNKPEEVQGSKPKVHVVQQGETLYGISRKYGISLDDLKKWNEWELKIGQELRLEPPQKNNILPETKPVVVTTPKVETPPTPVTTPVENKKTEVAETPLQPTPKPVEKAKEEVVAVQPEPIKKDTAVVIQTKKKEIGFGGKLENQEDESLPGYPDDGTKRVLIIPFDPYLYFSDADDEIAVASKIPRVKVREFFRRRLNALMDPPGYETIHLLGGTVKDSLKDLDRIYKSIAYMQDNIKGEPAEGIDIGFDKSTASQSFIERTKKKLTDPQKTGKAIHEKDKGKYYGVKINDPENFFNYFNNKYHVRYYVFINQFDVKTLYEHCLDRARQDYERNFITHFTIFDSNGNQVAGNRVKIFYNSNSNSIYQIINDNMQKVADAIIAQIPKS